MAISRSNLWKKRLGDYVVNPYVGCEHGCYHCYCPAMPGVKFFNNGHTQREWGEYLYPKNGFIEALRRDVRRHKNLGSPWGQGWVLLSFLTDCYTPAEAKHKLTRQALEIMLGAGLRVRIQTRSALVERDIDIIKTHPGQVIVGTSLPYLDDRLARILEPKASSPTRRLRMLEKMKENSVPVYVAVAPFLPIHGERELVDVLNAVAGLDPVEVFDEVVNPMQDNMAMMEEALQKAGETGYAFSRYSEDWPQFTVDHLRMFLAECNSRGLNGIAWPSPKLANSAKISHDDQEFLKDWLPRTGCDTLGVMDAYFNDTQREQEELFAFA